MTEINEIHDFNYLGQPVRELLHFFAEHGIAQRTYRHPPVFTAEEGVELDLPGHIPGHHGKSLFLKDGNGRLWLVVAVETNRVDLKKLAAVLQCKRFSFASPALMLEVLGVTPGSATPFALVNDTQRRVSVVIDKTFATQESCVFHPLDNRYSTVMAFSDLLKLLHFWRYDVNVLAIA